MSQDLPPHINPTPDSAPYFSGRLVQITETNVVDDQKLKIVDFFVCCITVVFKNSTNEQI